MSFAMVDSEHSVPSSPDGRTRRFNAVSLQDRLDADMRGSLVDYLGSDILEDCKEMARLRKTSKDAFPHIECAIAECLLKNQRDSLGLAVPPEVHRALFDELVLCAQQRGISKEKVFDHTLELRGSDFSSERMTVTERAIDMVNGVECGGYPYEAPMHYHHIVRLTAIPMIAARMVRFNLAFSPIRMPAMGLSVISNFKALECLKLQNHREIRFDFLDNASFTTTLKHLDVTLTSFSEADLLRLAPYNNLETLKMESCRNVSGENLEYLSCKHKLSTLNLDNTHNLSHAGFTCLSSFDALVTLHLRDCRVSEEAFNNLSLFASKDTLEHMDLGMCLSFTDANLRLLSEFTRLSYLALEECTKLTGEGFRRLGQEKVFPSLKDLDLSNCPNLSRHNLSRLLRDFQYLQRVNLVFCKGVDEENLKQLSRFEDLESLEIGYKATKSGIPNKISGRAFPTFAAMGQLRELVLTHCGCLEPTLTVLQGFSALEVLRLRHCENVTAKGMQGCACQNTLRKFTLDKNVGFDEESMSVLAEFTELTNVGLIDCTGIKEDGFLCLKDFKSRKKIKSFYVSGNTQFTDEALSHLKDFPMLTDLILRSCTGLTGDGFEKFESSSALYFLDLQGSSNFAEKSLEHLAKFTGLINLNLAQCKAVTGEGFQHFHAPYTIMKYLSLSDTAFSEENLEFLARFTSLHSLSLRNCVGVTGMGFLKFGESHELMSLDVTRTGVVEAAEEIIRIRFPYRNYGRF
ncbi:hypothetical protein CYMTET_31847 [Cymbomonas tetramitiformis]|uniref:F-box/LRR-repeat protein 15-like leucin rich repeat domain-containing protein n=1 Tax=Cymbomonas tetramitiformis TaxID=36881 RepID=A0AAE0KSI7_9CHLO|nr:hypothetical protein CYMTET_31847 [Cymbomonas tetramitiformis]